MIEKKEKKKEIYIVLFVFCLFNNKRKKKNPPIPTYLSTGSIRESSVSFSSLVKTEGKGNNL